MQRTLVLSSFKIRHGAAPIKTVVEELNPPPEIVIALPVGPELGLIESINMLMFWILLLGVVKLASPKPSMLRFSWRFNLF